MFDFIKQEIIPGWHASRVNRLISKRYEDQEGYSINLEALNGEYSETIANVKGDLEEQTKRKGRIDEKSKSLLFTIAVSITAITFSLNYISNLLSSGLQVFAVIILFFSISYLVMGSIRALQALKIRKFNVIQIEIEKNDSEFILIKKLDDEPLLKDLIMAKQLNDLIITQLTNFTSSSFSLIRNGMVLFMLFFISTIAISYYSHQKVVKDSLTLQKELTVRISDEIDVLVPYTIDFEYKINNLRIIEPDSDDGDSTSL